MLVTLRILSYFGKYWQATALAFICLFLVTGIELAVPELIRRVIDCGIRVGPALHSRIACPSFDPMTLASTSALLIVGLTVLKGLFAFGQGYLGEYGAQNIAYDIRNDIYRHLQQLSFSWHDRSETGQLMARATSDVEQLRHFTGRAFIQLAQIVLLGAGIAVILFATNWKLAIVSMLTLPLLIHTVRYYTRSVQPLFRQAQQELAVLAAIIQENLAGAKVVRAFAREDDEIRKFDRQNETLQEQLVAAAEIQAVTNPLLDAFGNLATLLVLWFGGYLVVTGDLSVGQFVAFNTYLLLIIRPIRRVGFLIGQTSRAVAAGERIFEILDASVEVKSRPDAYPLPTVRGHIVFDHVSCSYYGGEPVLRDVSFEANPGQVIALLGATGSGKTTIVNLIPRFYDVGQGRVLVDGHDVRDVELLSLRRQVGMVLQDTTLFTGTIRENIAFGAPDATDEQIVAMAQAARAHSFITECPEGYNTRVGERGVTLSGGQKQRIAIARALLLDPRVLILDDFTSAVDTETEALIRQALDTLMEERTTFVIAQRVSTVQHADQIIVLDHGSIVGVGKHAELLETNSIYAEIYQLQLTDETVLQMLGIEQSAAVATREGWPARNGSGEAWDLAGSASGARGGRGARSTPSSRGRGSAP